jgi:hypothetical protein
MIGLLALLVASALPAPAPTLVRAEAAPWTATFDGRPDSPQPWSGEGWDVQVHSRDVATWQQLEPMAAHHGPDCAAPPAAHPIAAYEDAVFLCNGHVMTAINASGYGVIYLTPDRMVDFSAGEAVVRFDMSTFRTSGRDWPDVWLSPFEEQFALPLQDWLPDLTGQPRRAVQVSMSMSPDESTFGARIMRNYKHEELKRNDETRYESLLVPSAVRRDTFELRISRTTLKFGMPQYNVWWIDAKFADLGWDKAVLQLGHHSYNPEKDDRCQNGCAANTWHWDNVSISTARPFTILKPDQARVDETTRSWIAFPKAAPAGSYLRFAGIGGGIDVSFDGGRSWYVAQMHPVQQTAEDHVKPYWMPVPAGTTRVDFRGKSWYGGGWMARGISIWSLTTE